MNKEGEHCSLRRTLGGTDRLRIHIERGPQRGMPHQLLHHLELDAEASEQGGVGVAKCVPPDPFLNTQLLSGRLDIVAIAAPQYGFLPPRNELGCAYGSRRATPYAVGHSARRAGQTEKDREADYGSHHRLTCVGLRHGIQRSAEYVCAAFHAPLQRGRSFTGLGVCAGFSERCWSFKARRSRTDHSGRVSGQSLHRPCRIYTKLSSITQQTVRSGPNRTLKMRPLKARYNASVPN